MVLNRLRLISAWCSWMVLIGAMADVAAGSRETPPPSTVVLLTIDTLRADAVSFMGCARKTSPFLDSLAARAVVFDRAYSPTSWTLPAIASMFTDRYPSSHGVLRGRIGSEKTHEVYEQTVLPAVLTTLAEHLRGAGYRTIGVAANRHLQQGSGFEQGFDHYYQEAAFLTAEDLGAVLRQVMTYAFGKRWRKKWKKEKVFLWLHYFDPHHPYFPRMPWIQEYAPDFASNPQAFPWRLSAPDLIKAFSPGDHEMARRMEALYLSEIAYTDQQVRVVFGELGLDDDDLVIFTSDHGEELGEHGRIGHRHTLFEEVVRVPLFVHRPAVLPASRVGAIVNLVDIVPTLAELIPFPPAADGQGRSLGPLLCGGSGAASSDGSGDDDAATFLELHPPHPAGRAVVTDRWKLLQPVDGRGNRQPLVLYDLGRDAAETKNVASEHPEVARRLKELLDVWVAGLPAPPATRFFSSKSADQIEQLRALGYIDD